MIKKVYFKPVKIIIKVVNIGKLIINVILSYNYFENIFISNTDMSKF